ncbi:MAG: hypothetical protein MUF30_02280 [Burkholderiales bacterium]|jgi:type II secretory pathway pseudopilin PulG|nr:hypothetical protein [Burkholderiales bacterium]
MRHRRRSARGERGFTLSLVLMVAFVAAVLAAAAAKLWSAQTRADRERELVWVGRQYQRGVASFAGAVPPDGVSRGPQRLDELVDDRRFTPPRRHLRRLYRDPFTGRADWIEIRGADGAIVGVRSRATATPRPADGLWPDTRVFGPAKSVGDWAFVARAPRSVPDASMPAPEAVERALDAVLQGEPAASTPADPAAPAAPPPAGRAEAAPPPPPPAPPAPSAPPALPPGVVDLLRELGLDPDADGGSKRAP